MALRKPLVVIQGQKQELPAGDTLDAPVTGVGVSQMTNGNAGAISKGQVVYINGANSVDLAKADALGTSNPTYRFVRSSSIAPAAIGDIQHDGVLDGFTGLTPGAKQCLSAATAGLRTEVAPTGAGEVVILLGKAISTTEIEIEISDTVLLV